MQFVQYESLVREPTPYPENLGTQYTGCKLPFAFRTQFLTSQTNLGGDSGHLMAAEAGFYGA